ncbi:MAG: IPT/TIG domain-containing protein, partial [Bdellovibrionales bacterium]|nr:IPT/TIG domain-containing protein [Bdellovibrionales bacterium]
ELGGTFITITGSGFKPNPTILINDVLCNQVVFISSSQVTCVTPVYSPGLYDVKITNSDNQSSILLNSYSYLENDFPPPTIESVVPNSGSESGGTLIQITGTGFRNGIAVTIGEAVCEVQSVQETTLSCQTNASDFGEENLTVTNIDNKSDILPNGYTYTQDNPPPIPIIYEINPSQGNIQGGETILIFGSGLFNGSEVYMGGARCEMTSFIDGNPVDLLYCKTPAHAKGISDVIIRNDRVKFSNILSFEFIDPNYQTPTPITPTPPPVLPPIEEKTEENNGFDPKTQKKSASPVTRPLQSCGETSAAIPSVSYIVYFLNYLIGLGISFLFRFKK